MHSLGIVQWNSTRRDHPRYPGRVSGTGPVMGHTHRYKFGFEKKKKPGKESQYKVSHPRTRFGSANRVGPGFGA